MRPVIIQQLIKGMKNRLPLPDQNIDLGPKRRDHTGLILTLCSIAVILAVVLTS